MTIKYDFVVCGGGTAGIAAGYIAAKLGLKTLIIEKNIHLGGAITSALVIPAMKSNTNNINCEFYNDFILKMKKFNAQITYGDGNTGWFNPELAKMVLDEMMCDVGCDVLFDTNVIDANFSNKTVYSIKVESKGLSLHIESLYFLDATGDANFSHILKNNILKNNSSRQPMTLRFHVSGINLKSFSKWLLEIDNDTDVTTVYNIDGQIHLSTACTWDNSRKWALWPVFEKGIKNGDITEQDASYFQIFTVPAMKDTVSLNCPRIATEEDIDPLDIIKVSRAIQKGRKQIWRIYNFMKKYFVGFENAYISNIADMLGIRESRRVEGQKIYTKNDLLSNNTYENPVLHANYPIDIHSYKKDSSTLQNTTVDYELPIECLCISNYNNVFVAGRSLSADFEAQAALRIQTSCFSMGESVAKEVFRLLKKENSN